MIQREKVDLFLDSGAFSAWTQGTEININEYIAFVQKHQDIIEVYANLDVIGDPKATWKNQKIMEAAGLTPLPTFHYGEDIKWLERYLRSGYDYIALGGMVPISTSALKYWLDGLFYNYLCTPSGVPKVKVHGFGLTALSLILRYPWYSIDSTTWVIVARIGGAIYVPKMSKEGVPIYNKTPWVITTSSRNKKILRKSHHISTFSPKWKALIVEYIESHGYQLGRSNFKHVPIDYQLKQGEKWAGRFSKSNMEPRLVEVIEEPGVVNTYRVREELNIIYLQNLERSFPEWPVPFKPQKTNYGFGL